MSGSDWVIALTSFLGAGLGGALAWWGTRRSTDEVRVDSRRDEWGRRFTSALAAVGSADERQRALGRIILVQLTRSTLASDDDRELADRVLQAIARPPGAEQLPAVAAAVDADRIGASRALIDLRGAPEAVDPTIRALAAQPLPDALSGAPSVATDSSAPPGPSGAATV